MFLLSSLRSWLREHYASVIQSKNINLGANFCLFGHVAVTAENNMSI